MKEILTQLTAISDALNGIGATLNEIALSIATTQPQPSETPIFLPQDTSEASEPIKGVEIPETPAKSKRNDKNGRHRWSKAELEYIIDLHSKRVDDESIAKAVSATFGFEVTGNAVRSQYKQHCLI